MIFFLFEPMNIKKQEFIDVPLFNIKDFTMYEINKEGLETLMTGEQSLRYADRYIVKKIDFTDNSKELIANMKADSGLYKNEIVDLDGNVTYIREDGLAIDAKNMRYNRKTFMAVTKEPFVAYMGDNKIYGTSLEYNAKEKKILSKKVEVIYQINEKKI